MKVVHGFEGMFRSSFPLTWKGYTYVGVGRGWIPLLFRLCKAIERELEKGGPAHQAVWRIHDIKEKYGTLRFYTGPATDRICKLVDAAESASSKICEHCGEPGRLRTDGWCSTRCDVCYKGENP